ncbi:hypothetical protein AVEN_252970-1 [Araneus ventricosus]|uniref:Uncharacterized protein n=1 Tax=Araneus ventricosus TaxID=182803 RepID=A0A4Y2T127_ARAVE|nr:hypothetical protein AVEN_252970-1 [Araneus ventricosus]
MSLIDASTPNLNRLNGHGTPKIWIGTPPLVCPCVTDAITATESEWTWDSCWIEHHPKVPFPDAITATGIGWNGIRDSQRLITSPHVFA